MTIRSTYALDLETVERLDALSKRWDVSKSEALRRAVRAAGADAHQAAQVDALGRLQAATHLTTKSAGAWARRVTSERAKHSKRVKTRG